MTTPVTPYDAEFSRLKQLRVENSDHQDYYDRKIAVVMSKRDVWMNGYHEAVNSHTALVETLEFIERHWNTSDGNRSPYHDLGIIAHNALKTLSKEPTS